MASSTGPKFAALVSAPQEWNLAGSLEDNSVALRLPNGEGWVVEVFSRSFRERLLLGKETWIFLAHIIREDAELLYAFETVMERALFIELRELDSIGPKTAAIAVAALGTKALSDLLHGAAPATYKVPGLGPKTLEKLAIGLKGKQEKFLKLLAPVHGSGSGLQKLSGPLPPALLIQSMEKLGLRPTDTMHVYRELLEEDPENEKIESAELLRKLLQRWGQIKSRLRPVSETEA